MTELNPSLLPQPADVDRPSGVEIFNAVDVFSAKGFPFFARSEEDYAFVGGLRLAAYERGDSPSRDTADAPYNATWFEHLRHHYGGALKLLEGLRQTYIQEFSPEGALTSDGILDIYQMGVHLPNFLMWRGQSPIRNGEIPPDMSVLRQALLGVGTVLLRVDPDSLTQLSGKDVADIAEKNGDLVGDGALTDLPIMVCPASPEMIAGLSEALLNGNEKRGTGTSLSDYNVDIRKLRQFVGFIRLHTEYEDKLLEDILALCAEVPVRSSGLPFQRPKTKVQRYDDLITAYGAFLDTEQPSLYEALGRTDTPPTMNKRRIYKMRKELLSGRLNAAESDPDNLTREVLEEFQFLLPAPE